MGMGAGNLTVARVAPALVEQPPNLHESRLPFRSGFQDQINQLFEVSALV